MILIFLINPKYIEDFFINNHYYNKIEKKYDHKILLPT